MGCINVYDARLYNSNRQQLRGEKQRKDCVREYLSGIGFDVNTHALTVIDMCDDWYANRVIDGFHNRTNLNGISTIINQLGFAKRCCADDANLCEIISVSPDQEEAQQEFINALLINNRFDVRYREQLEKTSATGTVGAYIYLKGADVLEYQDGTQKIVNGKIMINYVDADCIIPLTIENKLVTECAFASTEKLRGKDRTTLVIFTKNDNDNYTATTVYFNDKGQKIEEPTELQLGEVKPFAIMQNAEVNNLDNMEGYGLPKIYNAIPFFKAIDLCYALLYGDLNKGDKLVFINELLACISLDEEGMPTLTPQQKEIFVMLGKELPDKDTVIKEYNPELRIEVITKAFELVLSLISMQFGYGTRKYSFDNGQIQTATEYIGEKQDEIQELNKQRKQAHDYIEDIVHAAIWFSNTFNGTNYNVEEVINVDFDDSYIEDKASRLESMRADALSFPDIKILTLWYIMEKYNISEEEARTYVDMEPVEEEEPLD